MKLTQHAAALVIGLLVGCASPSQDADPIPREARRRIAQMVWPANLFDSLGQPDRNFVIRGCQPAFADLSIRRVATPAVLPNVTLYVGTARSANCSHGGSWTYAVAQRDSVFLTLERPDDIEYLAEWATAEALADSVALREFIITALETTCLVGCELSQVKQRGEVTNADTPFLRAADECSTGWTMPRTYSSQRNGSVLVAFALDAPGYGVYGVQAQAERGRGLISLAISPVAFHVLP